MFKNILLIIILVGASSVSFIEGQIVELKSDTAIWDTCIDKVRNETTVQSVRDYLSISTVNYNQAYAYTSAQVLTCILENKGK